MEERLSDVRLALPRRPVEQVAQRRRRLRLGHIAAVVAGAPYELGVARDEVRERLPHEGEGEQCVASRAGVRREAPRRRPARTSVTVLVAPATALRFGLERKRDCLVAALPYPMVPNAARATCGDEEAVRVRREAQPRREERRAARYGFRPVRCCSPAYQ
eukprot:scaffold65754_cov90-Phaeocystis_antarctica.AAC.1